jgi:replicative DNA helicase
MPRPPKKSNRAAGSMLEMLVNQIDSRTGGAPSPDNVPTGFASLDRVVGGGFRRKDLVVLGGAVSRTESTTTTCRR